MPRSKTATDSDVFAVISFAVKRPVQPPPTMATSTGLRLVMAESSLFHGPCSEQFNPYCHGQPTLSRFPRTYRKPASNPWHRKSSGAGDLVACRVRLGRPKDRDN